MNPGVESMMKFARLGARVGARTLTEGQRAELKGVTGTLNIEFTGPDGGGWHVDFHDGLATVKPGLAEGARATVRLKPEDYLAMLAGDLSMSVAKLTGKVRVSGDGGFGMIFGAFVGTILNAKDASGLQGRVTRWAVRRALRKGGYAA
jgi:putative sterol carrier protein